MGQSAGLLVQPLPGPSPNEPTFWKIVEEKALGTRLKEMPVGSDVIVVNKDALKSIKEHPSQAVFALGEPLIKGISKGRTQNNG